MPPRTEVTPQSLTLVRISEWKRAGSPVELYVIDGSNEETIISCGVQQSFKSKKRVQMIIMSGAAYILYLHMFGSSLDDAVTVFDERKD